MSRFHIQATRGADGFDIAQFVHVTSLADGSVTALVDRLSVSC